MMMRVVSISWIDCVTAQWHILTCTYRGVIELFIYLHSYTLGIECNISHLLTIHVVAPLLSSCLRGKSRKFGIHLHHYSAGTVGEGAGRSELHGIG